MIQAGEALRNRIFFIIKENPGIVRTEIRDMLKLPNNVVTPAIKELVDQNMVVEGEARLSKTTNKPGKQLYVADDWTRELDSQNRIFE
jgi:predicted transcriptional regulator